MEGTAHSENDYDNHDNNTNIAILHDSENDVHISEIRHEPWRNRIAFWLLGLCNNFGYVVMLSAAHDILKEQQKQPKNTPSDHSTGFHCNNVSTGVILIADILPALFIKLTAPFYMQRINYHFRVLFAIGLFVASLVTVALSHSVTVSILGVVFASISSGVGEITFLAFSSYYSKTVISFWSSGTGMAGLAGSLAYAGLTQLGLSSRNTLLLLLVIALIWSVAFWVILKLPDQYNCSLNNRYDEDTPLITGIPPDRASYLPFREKLRLMVPLLQYMIPLFLVYVAEYTINQGLYELLYYKVSWLSQSEQYRWYQVDYQLAVFISRSSVEFIPIKNINIPTFIQWVILALLSTEASVPFMEHIWITLGIVFLEGLCGGSVYVNAFTMIAESSTPETKEFRMGAASMADSLGITLAGFASIPIHNAICKLRL